MPAITGTYKLTKSEKFDEFMKGLGVGMVLRKIGNSVTPTVTITEENGVYTLTVATTFKSTVINFKLGEEFEETTADGRVVKATLTLEGNKLIHRQIGDKKKKEKDSEIIRIFNDVGYDEECRVDDVVCTRVFQRQ